MTNVKQRATVKGLETQLKTVDGEISALNTQKKNILTELTQKNTQRQKLKAEIEKMKFEEPQVIISDHALVRYFERVMGIDIDEIKRKIVGERIGESIRTLGNGTFPSEDGEFKLRVKDKVVVTVVKE